LLTPLLVLALSATASADTTIKDYAVPIGSAYQVDAVLSVADKLPETSNSAKQYQMIGIPDGLGAYPLRDVKKKELEARYGDDELFGRELEDSVGLFMNHELTQSTMSEPTIGDPQNRGAFVSHYLLDESGDPFTGERAYDTVYQDDTEIGAAAAAGNMTPAFNRFCSGSLAWKDQGFDRPIYITGEENDSSSTFDGKGGQTVAVFDNQAHALSSFGHFAKENTLFQPEKGKRTVAFPLEDGPVGNSQLYLYVGEKANAKDATVLQRNGLIGGALYVFHSTTTGMSNETAFQTGTISGEWVEIPGAAALTASALETASDAAGAFAFDRIEDGAFDTKHKDEFYFDTTGGGSGNQLGRLYHLRLGGGNPADKPAQLNLVYNADQIIANDEDIAISPDNLDASDHYLMVQEDGTDQSKPVMTDHDRDGSIWRFPLEGGSWLNRVDVAGRDRVVELDPPGRDSLPVPTPGTWETSGIIDASHLFKDIAWIFDVQAHSPTTAPPGNTVEDGQLLLLRPAD
jgi:hypothetical protein